MKRMIGISIRALVLLALLMTSAVAFAQDEAQNESATTPPFIGIRYWHHDEGLFVTGIIRIRLRPRWTWKRAILSWLSRANPSELKPCGKSSGNTISAPQFP